MSGKLDDILDLLLLDEIAAEVAAEAGVGVAASAEEETLRRARALEAEGCWAWYAHMFGQDFVDVCAAHHREAIEWHWESRMAVREGRKPEYNSYFPIWSREHMKSTVARRIDVADACLSVSVENPRERGGYGLYVSRNKTMVAKHALSVEALITSPKIKELYPALSRVKRNEQGGSKGWQATFLNTAANYIFHFASLEEGLAGGNVEDWRPTIITLDDIDGREDSAVISENRFTTVTTEILPMAQSNTLVFFAQNYISRYSTMYRIHKGHARVLTDRKPTKPVPAVLNLVTEKKVVGGIVRDVIDRERTGAVTWPIFNLDECQDRINREGLPAFLRERQHEVEQDREGLVLQNWDDKVHVISKSEFAALVGTRDIPQHWSKHVFNDWARTKTKFHANVAGTIAVSAQNSRLPGCVFFFNPMSFPAASAPEEVAKRILTSISPTVRVNGVAWDWNALIKSTLQKTSLEHLIHNTTRLIEQRRTLLAKVIPERVRPILHAQNYVGFRCSHERTDVQKVYREVFGLPFVGTNPGADGGVDTLNLLMSVDYNEPHPFRRGMMGYTNFYLVVDDDPEDAREVKGPKPMTESLTPDELHDDDLVRYQFQNWRFRDPHITTSGEKEGELLKLNDDMGNGLMMLFHDNSVQAAPLTYGETVEAVLPDESQYEKLLERSPYEKGLTPEQELGYVIGLTAAKKIVKPKIQYFGDDDDLIRD